METQPEHHIGESRLSTAFLALSGLRRSIDAGYMTAASAQRVFSNYFPEYHFGDAFLQNATEEVDGYDVL